MVGLGFWRAGCKPENDAQGVLQDVHWSMGALGYFPVSSFLLLLWGFRVLGFCRNPPRRAVSACVITTLDATCIGPRHVNWTRHAFVWSSVEG